MSYSTQAVKCIGYTKTRGSRYNSVIFSSVSTNYYNFAVVPDSFLRGADWKTSDPYAGADSPDFTWLRQIQNRSSNLAHLDIEKCAQAFSNSYQSAYGDSLLVYKPSIESEPATVFGFGGDSSNRGVLTWCSEQDSCTYNGTSLVWNPFHNDNSDDDTLDVWVKIDYCAAVKTSEQCRVYVSYVFLVVVIICNGAKFVCFLYLLIPDDWQPLITIGDSIADFLRHWGDATEIIRGPSDTKTENNAQIQSKTVEIKDYHSNVEDDIQVSPRRRWASSPSRVRWVVTLLWYFKSPLGPIALKANVLCEKFLRHMVSSTDLASHLRQNLDLVLFWKHPIRLFVIPATIRHFVCQCYVGEFATVPHFNCLCSLLRTHHLYVCVARIWAILPAKEGSTGVKPLRSSALYSLAFNALSLCPTIDCFHGSSALDRLSKHLSSAC